MTDSHTDHALRELIAQGHLAALPAPQHLARGNIDRMDAAARSSWLVSLPAGGKAKLTLGRDLASLAARHAALAAACPTVTTAQLAYVRQPAFDALIESFFDGPTLESAAGQHLLPPAIIRQAMTGIGAALAATEQPSSDSARITEWHAWTRQLLALPVWQPAEASSLEHVVLPALYQRLAAGPAVARWTNGDFLPSNILLNAGGEARLIDAEFASRTHFFAEDAVRFRVLSPVMQNQPDLFTDLVPERALPWHLYFWLRQFQLETEQNTAAYLARVQPVRLGTIRRLSEVVLGCQLNDWSSGPTEVHYTLEVANWQQTPDHDVVLTGWCHVPSVPSLRALVVTHGDAILASTAPSPRPDVQAHFADASHARATGFKLVFPLGEPDALLVLSAVTAEGTWLPFHSFPAGDLPGRGPRADGYPHWATLYDPDPVPPPKQTPGPLFSILIPVYNTPPDFLRACLESVRQQHHPDWEICLVNDASSSDAVEPILADYAARDQRIKTRHRASNGGISLATNDALAMARGEFVVLLDHDDVLRPHALVEFARKLTQEPDLDAIYSDEDKITAGGQRLISFLKPDYSPELLLGVMYVGHALCIRTSVARSTGQFDSVYDGVQDYEFFLRVTEQTRRIGHVPRILYHWRQSPDSSALHGNIKGDMDQKHAAAVTAHLRRQGRTEQVVPCGRHRLRLSAPTTPTVELVRPGPNQSPLAALRQAADTSRAEVLILLSIELQTSSADWTDELAAVAILRDSALVAPLILSREGRVLESGWTVGPAGAGPLMRGFDPAGDGYNGSLSCTREVAAVSFSCVAVRRALCGASLASAAAGETWPDFCRRMQADGRFHRVCAPARIQTPASWRDPVEPLGFALAPDPFFNRQFNSRQADYSLARPPPHAPPVRWHLDSQFPSTLPNGCLNLRGWCFGAGGEPVRALRLACPSQVFFGAIGLPRPDVRAALAEAPDNNTGFEVHGVLPAGRIDLSLEARLAGDTWHQLMACTVEVKQPLLPRWLGGGGWMELMFFQMPAHMAYPARPVRPEKFPVLYSSPRPKLSIVTPSYNQARFLPETMRSVLDQAGVTCEYVVQDGGSTDESKALIERIAAETENRRPKTGSETNPSPASRLLPPGAPRLVAWESAPDKGQADAIARGFAQTSGTPEDLMAWINSDDFYLPGTLAYVADYFARHPDIDVLYGHRIVVNEESQEIGRWFLPRHDPEVLRLNDFVPQETLFWRRRIWDRVGGLDPAFQFAMDWDLLLRFQAAGARTVRVPRFLACFRVHAAQKTSAQMHAIGQKEISHLRERTQGRTLSARELEHHPRLLRYLRRSAFIQWLWSLGFRAP